MITIEEIQKVLKETRIHEWKERTGYRETGGNEPAWKGQLDKQQAEAIYNLLQGKNNEKKEN